MMYIFCTNHKITLLSNICLVLNRSNIFKLDESKKKSNSNSKLKEEDEYSHEDSHEDLHEDSHQQHSTVEHIRNTKPWKIHVYIENYPVSCCLFFFSWFIICGLIVLLVPGILEFSTEVPFYDRDNQATIEEDALIAGEDDANWERQSTSGSLIQQQSSISEVELQLIYKVKNGNTLGKEKFFKLIDEIEDKIKTRSGYNDVCYRLYHDNGYTCARHSTITNFFDKEFFIPSINQNYTIYPSIDNYINFAEPSLFLNGTIEIKNKNYTQENINNILLYWAGYDEGHGPTGDYVQKYYNGEPMPGKFNLLLHRLIFSLH